MVAVQALVGGATTHSVHTRSKVHLAWRALRRDRIAVISLVVIIVAILAAILAPLLAPYDPLAADGAKRLLEPGTPGHIFGLDDQGRDILSRLIYGARYSMTVAIVPVLIAGAMSLFLGMTAGYLGGRIAEFVMRALDVIFAFPIVLFAIALAAVFGPGLFNSCLAIGITLVPYMSRVVYTATVQEHGKEYVEAAKASGATHREVMVGQLLPNVLSPLVVYGTALAGLVIVLASGLSFLGVGVVPPAPDWGTMTADGRSVLLTGKAFVATIPGVVILIVSLAFNLLGDGIRDALDPHKQTA